MRLLPRLRKEYVTTVQQYGNAWGFEMSPGVTVLIQANEPGLDDFSKKLAQVIQRVAHDEWV